jgi:hypothetical protein
MAGITKNLTPERAARILDLMGRMDAEGIKPPVGRSYGTSDGAGQRVRHTADGMWWASAFWPTPEAYDDDPESRTCWCPLSMTPHAHADAKAATWDELREVVSAAAPGYQPQDVASRPQPRAQEKAEIRPILAALDARVSVSVTVAASLRGSSLGFRAADVPGESLILDSAGTVWHRRGVSQAASTSLTPADVARLVGVYGPDGLRRALNDAAAAK